MNRHGLLAKEAFKAFKLGLERHIVWEEDPLFPLWEEKTGMSEGGPTPVMRCEHSQIKQFLDAMHHKVEGQISRLTRTSRRWSTP